MNTKGLLDQLLRAGQAAMSKGSGSGSGLGAGLRQAGGALNQFGGFGGGALAGGALGLLLGGGRLSKFAGKAMSYGGTAALGALAYKAYSEWQQQSQGNTAAPPRTVDRLPAAEAEEHSRGILVALIAAAKSDGHVDARERGLIETEMARLNDDPGLKSWLHGQLEQPLDPVEVARHASSPELAAEMYLASVMLVDDTQFMERAYLDELARRLELAPELKTRLEQQARPG